MIRILHAADLHLDALFRGLPPEAAAQARREQLDLPRRLVHLAQSRGAQMVLLSGDLFDRPQATLDSPSFFGDSRVHCPRQPRLFYL